MASLQAIRILGTRCDNGLVSVLDISSPPNFKLWGKPKQLFRDGMIVSQSSSLLSSQEGFDGSSSNSYILKNANFTIPRCSNSPNPNDVKNDSSEQKAKVPFGYSRKDVLLIGFGVGAIGFGLKYGLELLGVDSLKAGNVVQIVMVLGVLVGWVSTYLFRVANKEMTYAQQLRDYENKVIQKRFDELSEGELEALLEEVEEDKRRMAARRKQRALKNDVI